MTPPVETEQENSRLITLMLQVATMDGKLDIMISSLADRVKKLEEKNSKTGSHLTAVIAVVISGIMCIVTLLNVK